MTLPGRVKPRSQSFVRDYSVVNFASCLATGVRVSLLDSPGLRSGTGRNRTFSAPKSVRFTVWPRATRVCYPKSAGSSPAVPAATT